MWLFVKLNMKNKIFEVKIYHSGFSTHRVKAKTENEAIKKARKLPIKESEMLSNLESWQEADDVEEIEKYAKDNK